VPQWQAGRKPLWRRRLGVLLWSFPALVAMTVVWFEPQWWLYLILGLIGFHLVALTFVCVGGLYHVNEKKLETRV
jgi:CHASE1-domain containing sensor protein